MNQHGRQNVRIPPKWKAMPPEVDQAMHAAAEEYMKQHGKEMTLGGLYRALFRAAPAPKRNPVEF